MKQTTANKGYEVRVNGVAEVNGNGQDRATIMDVLESYRGIDGTVVVPMGSKTFKEFRANPVSRTCHNPYGFFYLAKLGEWRTINDMASRFLNCTQEA